MDDLAALLKDPRAGQQTAETLSGLSGTDEGADLIRSAQGLVSSLVDVCANCVDDSSEGITYHALACLANISADEATAESLSSSTSIIDSCVSLILDHAGSPTEGAASMLLTNLTRHPEGAVKLAETVAVKNCVHRLLNRLASTNNAETNSDADHNVDHLASVLCNLSQVEEGRAQLTTKEVFPLLLLKTFPNFTRLFGIISAIKNCTVDEDRHEELLAYCADGNLAVTLAFPIAGGGRPLSEFDKRGMPPEVIEFATTGSACVEIEGRKIAFEAILKLCRTRAGRDYFRKNKIYPVLRERHLLEEDSEIIELIEWFVDRTHLQDEIEDAPLALPSESSDPGAEESPAPTDAAPEEK